MYHPKTRWILTDADAGQAEELAQELGVHPIIAQLLTQRGMDNKEKAARFLHISADGFYDPFLLNGMDKAVMRIHHALEHNEKIWIYGDYDADGVTSTSVLIETFKLLGQEVDFYIPNRFTEGYGLHQDALKLAADQGVSLVITVDTGISAVEEATLAASLGLDLIITDHHEPPAVLPDAYAVINPKQPACDYPDPMLAGVGVAFKLAHALLGRAPEKLLPLAALGTIADLVPLIDENRIIAALGLKKINEKQHVGINALLQVAGLSDREVTAGHIGFALGPRLNASGRLDTAIPAVQLLTSRDPGEALLLAEQLDDTNKERQTLVDQLTTKAMAHVEANEDQYRYAIVIAEADWNIGVLGIVASRLVERFYRPAVVLGIDKASGQAKGSARSIAEFDMYRALSELADLLPHFGGHKMAAGMTMAAADVDAFRQRLNALASEWLKEDDFKPMTSVDAVCTIDEIGLEWVEQLSRLEPFGVGNPAPRFHITDAQLKEVRRIGKEQNHLKLALATGDHKLQAVGFHMGEAADGITVGANLEAVGELQMNEWNGNRSTQLVIKDVSVPHLQVFDWRGRNINTNMWNHLVHQRVSFVCYHQGNLERLPPHFRHNDRVIPAWQDTDKETAFLPQGEKGYPYVALVDYPPEVEQFDTLLRTFPKLERVYFLGETEEDVYAVPQHHHFKQVYALIHRDQTIRDWKELARQTKLSEAFVMFILDVFHELGFVVRAADAVTLKPNPQKRSLTESQLLRQRQARFETYQTFYYASAHELAEHITKVRTAAAAHLPGGDQNGFETKNSDHPRLPAKGCPV